MTNAERFNESIVLLLKDNGSQGTLKCKPLTDYNYNPSTGEVVSDGPSISVQFVFASLKTLQDQDMHRRALQKDTGLDNLIQGRVIFDVVGGEEPSEAGSLVVGAKEYHFSDLQPFTVNGTVVAYSALHTGVA